MKKTLLNTAIGLALAGLSLTALASSHREAPSITGTPKVDGSDFYMFRSYEPGRAGYVTLIANYLPLQAAYGGPNYFDMEKKARYQIHIDNNGDAKEDLTFSFNFNDVVAGLKIPVGDQMVSVPLKNIGGIGPNREDTGNVNVRQTYEVSLIDGPRRTGTATKLTHAGSTDTVFRKPMDNIGNKSIPDYAAYAGQHVYEVNIPNCNTPGRVFAGQRKEGFAVNLGEVFDLVNTNPLGPVNGESNVIGDTNVTSLALEIPIACLTNDSEAVIGAWTTASVRRVTTLNPNAKGTSNRSGPLIQVSRLGMPLVNELVIGLTDKDRFNASQPENDGQFLTYVTNPTLPALLEILFADAGAVAPKNFPRTDLVSAFLTGVPGLNQPAGVTPSEMLRLNTTTAVTTADAQNNLGVLGGDLAGFPNGRRPGDDVVDAALRVVMGALISDPEVAPNNNAPFTDGATVSAADFDTSFPYLKAPLAGAGQ